MLYLECMALLNFLLKKLSAGQRQQVPVSVTDEAQTILVSVRKRLQNENDTETMVAINDLMLAVNDVKKTDGLLYLTDTMKQSLIEGTQKLNDIVAMKAFYYYKVHDYTPTKQTIPVMRSVVRVALAKGVL